MVNDLVQPGGRRLLGPQSLRPHHPVKTAREVQGCTLHCLRGNVVRMQMYTLVLCMVVQVF
jgi:hypothetical protein